MRLSGRIAAAIEIVDALRARPRPISLTLKEWAAAHRFAGSKDRAAIGNLVYDVERQRLSLAYQSGSEAARASLLLLLARQWGIDPQDLNVQFNADKFAPEPINADELAMLNASADLASAPAHVQADLPEWIAPKFETAFADDWIDEGQVMTLRPPLDLRANALAASREKVEKSLKRFKPIAYPLLPNALRIPSGNGDIRTPNIQSDEAYQKGWVEVQDAGSQIVSALVGASTQSQVLDFCAGGGGKTLALAAQMQNKGQIFAHDADQHRLAPIYARLKKNHVRNVQVVSPHDDQLSSLKLKMPHVLVDAPCTGTGTWRRHPDTKWRLTPEQLAKRTSEQWDALNQAKDFVAQNGRLIYVTCSVLPEENDEQMERFIAENGIFAPIEPQQIWREAFGDAPCNAHQNQFGLTFTPAKSDTDGFYISVLQRSA